MSQMEKNNRQATSIILFRAAILSSMGLIANTGIAENLVLEEVIVTAQKREQSLQDVPVAVTALTQDALEVNKIINVNDLSGMAPGLTVRPAAGGTNLPAFNMRGITSYGVVAGSDKQISTYLDGVYIGSPRGSIFTLPDIQQLEVLRGPQGTIFGRNATGGAINIRTRNPTGEFGIIQSVGFGNLAAFTARTTIDFPAVGPFSAYLSYAKEERDGAVKNLGAGVVWDRSAYGIGVETSPDTLGEVDTESFFVAAQLDLDNIRLTYKFDYSTDEGSPRASAFVNDPAPLLYAFSLQGLTVNSPPPFSTTRPSEAENAWSTTRDQTVQGHSLVAEWEINDVWSIKNTFAYRESEINQPADIGGGTLPITVATPFGNFPGHFCLVCSFSLGESEQTSDEFQVNYDTDSITAIFGALWYESEDKDPGGQAISFTPFFGDSRYVLVNPDPSRRGYNEAESKALYGHVEYSMTNNLSLQVGLRKTWDEKSGYTINSGIRDDFDYKDDNTSYLLGLNYHITDSIMAYGKWSTAYVSGGSAGGYAFEPEEVESFELGLKGDFIDGRVRMNIALYDVTYEHLQSSQNGPSILGDPLAAAALAAIDPVKYSAQNVANAGTFILEQGTLEAQGAEFEVTALLLEGLTLSGSLAFTDSEYSELTPELMAIDKVISASDYDPTLTAEWSGNLALNYESTPFWGTAYLSAGFNAIWQDKIRYQQDSDATPGAKFKPETWILNARVALKEITLGSRLTGELSVWGRNLLDEDYLEYPLGFGPVSSSTYMDPRTYGIDFRVNFH